VKPLRSNNDGIPPRNCARGIRPVTSTATFPPAAAGEPGSSAFSHRGHGRQECPVMEFLPGSVELPPGNCAVITTLR
jgi:hypothetical protein